ncbi:olfactory receptor 5G29-like [Ascaphus truei]|uniref:olfactory receptor 5G29-like n=1 Tax=Ascaphus truei TaxID=8439 RepID=UPI003F59AB32
MYFFLGHLSLCDILFITNIVPYMLHAMMEEGSRLSVSRCIAQFHILGFSASTECFLLTVMSYDRYLAICNPLRYTTIMDQRLCLHLVSCAWLIALMLAITTFLFICKLQFCGPNVIDHFFCDLGPLLELSCTDTSTVKLQILVCSISIVVFPFVFITVSYVSIFLTIIRISSTTGRQKAFSTCSSHLASVCTYYGTLFVVYVVPSGGHSLSINKTLSLLYTVVTPLFNPIIYSLRNHDIRGALEKYTKCHFKPKGIR